MDLKQQVVGYARISTPQQRLNRQIDNLKAAYPNIIVIAETYSGKTENRPKWQKLLRQCRAGQVSKLVFDEVSRFSRNAEEATKEYKAMEESGYSGEYSGDYSGGIMPRYVYDGGRSYGRGPNAERDRYGRYSNDYSRDHGHMDDYSGDTREEMRRLMDRAKTDKEREVIRNAMNNL